MATTNNAGISPADLLSEIGTPFELTPDGESIVMDTFSALQKGVLPVLGANENIPAHKVIKTLVEEYAQEVFESPQQARAFITNKLLELSTCGDARHELRALELLGKLSDIGAFSEKSEVIVTAKSSADVDRQIKEKVEEILKKRGVSLETIIEAEVIDVKAEKATEEKDELDEVIAQRRQKDQKEEQKEAKSLSTAETVVENTPENDE